MIMMHKMCVVFKTSKENTYIYFFPTIRIDYKLITSLTSIGNDSYYNVFSADESCTTEEAVFCFPNDDPDDVVQYLGLSCNKNKHYSTILEACSTWTVRLEKRGRKDIYAKLSFTWPNDIYYTQ